MQTRRQALTLALAGAAAVALLALPLPALAAADAAGLVGALTSQLGVNQQQAEGGAGALFGLAKQRMAPDQFGQVEQSVPGIGSLISAAPALGGGQSSGGGLGGMAGGALGSLGGGGATGGLGALAPLAGSFSQLGLSPDMAGKFLPVILQYLNGNGAGSAAGLLKGALGG